MQSAPRGAGAQHQLLGSAGVGTGCTIEDGRKELRVLLKKVDAVTMRVPTLDHGIAFYVDRLGHRLLWRNDDVGQAGLTLPDSDTEIVLTTSLDSEPNWLVDDVPAAVEQFCAAGGTIVSPPAEIPVGKVAVVRDPFGNSLVFVDLSKGTYQAVTAEK